MTTVNATEFQKKVGEYSDIARREPVTVTRHGRASLVLLSAEDYARLRGLEARATRAMPVRDMPDDLIEALRDADLSHLPKE